MPGDTGAERESVPAVLLPVRAALPVLTRARATAQAHPTAVFWGAASVLALQFAARGLLLPGLTPTDHDAWRAGPLRAEDLARVGELAAAMPPEAHATPLDGPGPLRLPAPEALLRAFLDAVADTLPRSPAASLAAGARPFAATEPQQVPDHRAWAADVAAGHDAGVRISLRVEVPGLDRDLTGAADEKHVAFRAVLQMHSVSDPALVADMRRGLGGTGRFGQSVRAAGPHGRPARAAARSTRLGPLTPLLSAAVPDTLDLADEEITDLLGAGARALAAAGVDVHWPRQLARLASSARAVIGPPDERPPGGKDPDRLRRDIPSFLAADALLAFNWRFALGDQELSREELDRLAEANRPVVRLRDQWVLIDPEEVRRAREHQDRKVTPIDALGAVLTGSTEVDGRRVDVHPTGWLAELRERLADPEGMEPVGQPAALSADLRDYQLRGLNWLARMTSLGLGACLADDMGLGKTITLIALHLHRQTAPETAAPTLVVCPTSLMGNWQREIEKFAPGTPVRRFHGGRRSLDDLAAA